MIRDDEGSSVFDLGISGAELVLNDVHEHPMEDQVISVHQSPIGLCVSYLRDHSPGILASWVLRVANMPAFRAMPDIGLADVRSAIPSVLSGMLSALLVPDAALDPEPQSRMAEAAANHGQARAGAGFPLRVVLTEYHELRTALWADGRRWAKVSGAGSLPDELLDRFHRDFDVAMIAAADAWVDTMSLPAHGRMSGS